MCLCFASYTMLTKKCCHSECCQDSASKVGGSVVCYCLSNYLLQGHCVAVNMTWAPFCG